MSKTTRNTKADKEILSDEKIEDVLLVNDSSDGGASCAPVEEAASTQTLQEYGCIYCNKAYFSSRSMQGTPMHGCELELEMYNLKAKVDSTLPSVMMALDNLRSYLDGLAKGNNINPEHGVITLKSFEMAINAAIVKLKEAA